MTGPPPVPIKLINPHAMPRWTDWEVSILATHNIDDAIAILSPYRTACAVRAKVSKLYRQDPTWYMGYMVFR